jgi:hypothetical protein
MTLGPHSQNSPPDSLSGLAARGIGRLLAEGGTTIHTQLLG